MDAGNEGDWRAAEAAPKGYATAPCLCGL